MSVSAEIAAGGLSILDGFLSAAEVMELVECLESRRARGEFAAARIGSGRALKRREDIRGDATCWLAEPLQPPEARLLKSFEELRLDMNREAFLGLFELELHYAAYAPGAGYARHVDQPRGRTRRKISLVLYLNAGWTAADGGELRIFGDDGRYQDVPPIGGRLVCFLTPGQEHCVLPARRERLSVSGWFGTR